MKFTAGYWQMRPGVTPHYPVHVHEVEIEPDALTVYGPTKRLAHRGDTLNLPLLTVRLSSPLENVIRVQLYHHKGGRPRKPQFELLAGAPPEVAIHDDERAATLTSGRLTARVEKAGDWRIDFLDGDRPITHSGWRAMGFVDTEGPEYEHPRYIHEQLALGVGEYVYGLGERFTPLVKNGQAIDLWNEDGGTSSEWAYKNVPFYLSNRGYGVFINHPGRVSYEVASEAPPSAAPRNVGPSTSAGAPLASSPRTAGCTAPARTACPGSLTKLGHPARGRPVPRPVMCCAFSPGSNAA